MTDKTGENSVFILMTQCLQNCFFLSHENRLRLSPDIVMRMLVGDQKVDEGDAESNKRIDWTMAYKVVGNRRVIDPALTQKGPLYQFFDAVTGKSERKHPLHIIHVRDWHTPSDQYDEERKLYGIHCEAGSWEAEPVNGFETFLKPWNDCQEKAARSANGWRCTRDGDQFVEVKKNGNQDIIFYDVRSDSVFDFVSPDSPELQAELNEALRPIAEHDGTRFEIRRHSMLVDILDNLIICSGVQKVYIVVIGVYTDIKVKTLLVSLRSRYDVTGLFVSDVLTDAPSLERHLEGLDFAQKVVNAQIVHNLNDVVSILNPGASLVIGDHVTETTVDFSDYAHYFLDQTKLLAFQDQRLLKYVELAGARSENVYSQILQANTFLVYVGKWLLGLTVGLIILRVLSTLLHLPEVPLDVIVLMTGLTVTQILTSFFLIPSVEMRKNLYNLVRLRNYLETYSNVTALLRHHLTQAERLQPNTSDPAYEQRARTELSLLDVQIDMIQRAAERMGKIFVELEQGYGAGTTTPPLPKPSQPPIQPVGAVEAKNGSAGGISGTTG